MLKDEIVVGVTQHLTNDQRLEIATRICVNKQNLAHVLTPKCVGIVCFSNLRIRVSMSSIFCKVDFAKRRSPRRMHFNFDRLLSTYRLKVSHCEQMDNIEDGLLAVPSCISWTFPFSHKSKSG